MIGSERQPWNSDKEFSGENYNDDLRAAPTPRLPDPQGYGIISERQPLNSGKDASRNQLLKLASTAIRSGFVAKLYGILCAQLILTTIVASPFVILEDVEAWVKYHGTPMVVACLILNLAVLCVLTCHHSYARTFPQNYMLLGVFTVSEGVLVGVICSAYTLYSILWAVLATAVLVASLSCYAMLTKEDFTTAGPYLVAATIVQVIFIILTVFFPYPFMETLKNCFAMLLFSFFLIFDTQLIMGRGDLALCIDDYVLGALMIYTDIIGLFVHLLHILGGRE